MFARRFVRGLLLLCLGSALVGCANKGLDSIQVTPATQSLAVGQTTQFTAVGTYGNANHLSTRDLTSGVNWTSSTPAVATVNASGVATAVGTGTTTITAGGAAFNGSTSASATLTVTGNAGGGPSGGTLLSLAIIPPSIAVGNLQDTGQFLAIGTFSTSPTVRDLTNSPSLTWISATPSVFQSTTLTERSGRPPGLSPPMVMEAASSLLKQRAATGLYKQPRQRSAAPWLSQRQQLRVHAIRVRRRLRSWRP